MVRQMNLVHIVGRKNNGKTRLIVELLEMMIQRGLRVGTVKHSGHSHELDRPGKDSYLHRMAGGSPVAVITVDQTAVYMPRPPETDPIAQIESLFSDTDLVLVEGFIEGPGVKVEVWRKETGASPLITERGDIQAVVTDDVIDTRLPVWPRTDIACVVENICRLARI